VPAEPQAPSPKPQVPSPSQAYSQPMRRAGLLIGVTALVFLTACGVDDDAEGVNTASQSSNAVSLSPRAIETAGIETTPVERRVLQRTLSLTGTVAAKPWIPEEQAALSAAESADAARHLAESNYDRLVNLASEGVASQQDLDAAKASRDQARAAAAQVDAQLANLGLDESARRLERRARIWGLAVLPESELALVHNGAPVRVESSAYPGRKFEGRVVGISRSADPETRGFTVRIAIEDPSQELHPQMLATFSVSSPSSPRLSIPRSALLLEGDGEWVYLAKDHEFVKRRIRLGVSTADEVEVLEGLSEGERVVSQGAQILESERLKATLRPADED